MKVFQVRALSSSRVSYDCGTFSTQELAEAKIKKMKREPGWKTVWDSIQIWEFTVEGPEANSDASWEVDRLRAEGAYDTGRDGWR
jgi:hypothetical protein